MKAGLTWNRSRQGESFKIFFPLASLPAEPDQKPPPKAGGAGGKETILLVEDEQIVRRMALRVLQRQGYRVLEAASGMEALWVWDEHEAEIDLLLTDMVMPEGMSGRGWPKAPGKKAGLKVIYTTGYSQDTVGPNLVLEEGLNSWPNLIIPSAWRRPCAAVSTMGLRPKPTNQWLHPWTKIKIAGF